ncbi:MAG TPA: translational GTPase TypA [Candidatus Faecivivens stercoripullorum]|uniref:Large ribosomal subunit assembly factor BipA n=1 Tax=Candidatus Faecivivens stercoripullorum TaxID=2840805 RepID=A0A9D1KQC9_9FIRM|nr:translational GTPase TypA [Candidatus Faecivivens stercoripullorum]
MTRNDLRNIAIVAHVDHGKTTLLNEMLKQGGAFRENQAVEDRVMDSGDLERERGITITSKNTALHYKGTKINVIDTPGHADFGGEVERILKMVDGILLLVDAFEGCMPQTRFVLQKAMELGHKIIVVVNKIDRPDARLYEIEEEVLELLLDLNATEEQLDSPVVYCSGRDGIASFSPDHPGTDLQPLFDKIIEHIDPPQGDADGPLQMMVSSIDYNDYVGRIAVGRITRGSIRTGQEVTICDYHNPETRYRGKVVTLYQFDGLKRVPCETATVGDIVCVSGIENITIGETMCDPSMVEALPFQKISQPTVEMTFGVNTSPLAGREGKYVTSRQIRDRLHKELLKDVSLRVSDTDSADTFLVAGRGEMHLSILIETMRREGYEFQVSNPHAMFKEIDGVKCEPIERLVIDVPDTCTGVVMEKMGNRKGELQTMVPQGSRVKMEFLIPARGLFGYKNEFLTDTKGEGIMASVFDSYAPYKGDIPTRNTGSLISFETGTAVVYGLYNAQERGQLFIGAGVDVYEGMIVGQSPKAEDLVVNVCKEKHLTNTRSSGSDDALRLVPPKNMSLEQCIEFIAEDELIEVTPKNLRMRKVILDKTQRMKAWAAKRK